MFHSMVRCAGAILCMVMLGSLHTFCTPGLAQENEPVLEVDVTALAFAEGDTLKTFTITNAGGGTLAWSISVAGAWISADPDSGSLEAGMSETIALAVDRSAVLIIGVITGRVSISSDDGSAEIAVSAVVTEHPLLEVSPVSLDFGSQEVIKELLIGNRGNGVLSWSITEQAAWIAVEPQAGAVATGTTQAVYVMADRSGEQAWGSYADTMTVTSDGGEQAITVSMEKRNHPPEVPAVISPRDGIDQQPLVTALSCLGGDRDEGDGDAVSYDIFLSRDRMLVELGDVSALLCSQTAACYCDVRTHPLREKTTYYWKVLAQDSYNQTTPGDVWSFTTQAAFAGPCAATALGLSAEDMQALRRLRDEVLARDARGRDYIDSYYRFSGELFVLLLIRGDVRTRAANLYAELGPAVVSLLQNGEARLSEEQLQQISCLLKNLALYAEPPLKEELRRLQLDLLDRKKMERLGVILGR